MLIYSLWFYLFLFNYDLVTFTEPNHIGLPWVRPFPDPGMPSLAEGEFIFLPFLFQINSYVSIKV